MNPFEQAFRAYTAREGGQMHQRGSIRQQTYCYATFPIETALQPGDSLTGGIALNIKQGEATITAFILRQICANGMVAPHWFRQAVHRISAVEEVPFAMEQTLSWLREKGLSEMTNRFRRNMRRPVNQQIWDRISVHMVRKSIERSLLREIQREAEFESKRPSGYGKLLKRRWPKSTGPLSYFDVINGITAVARDEQDPEMQWKLMELGWVLLIGQVDMPPTNAQSVEKPAMRRRIISPEKEFSL